MRDKTTKRDFEVTARAGQIEFFQDGLKLTTRNFELTRGGKTRVKVTAQEIAEAKKGPLVKVDPGKLPDVKKQPDSDKPPAVVVIPKARALPFVLSRNGKEAGSAKSFDEVWLDHQAGDEILVYSDGPFKLERIDVKNKTLVLKAAPGFHPVFLPDQSVFGVKAQGWIRAQKGAVTIEHCDFVMRGTPPGTVAESLLGGDAGPCVLRGCRLIGCNGLLQADARTSFLTLEDCLVQCGVNNIILSQNLPAGCEVTLTNNVMQGNYLTYRFAAPGGQKLRLERNAICGFLIAGPFTDIKGVTVVAENNLFQTSSVVAVPAGFKENVHWQGKDNWYAGILKFSTGQPTQLTPEGWNNLQKEPEVNRSVTPLFAFGWLMDIPAQHEPALAWWQTRLADARRQSGLDDLGPDLSLVGPGKAYLRGLEQEGRGVPKDKQRPAPAEGGRIVLIRGGKDFQGFPELLGAFQAAQDGDVIEVRTDVGLKGCDVPKDRGTLTLRAGPGYRPTIQSPIYVLARTGLELEGLAFSPVNYALGSEVGKLPLVDKGRITRMAYCSFDRDEGISSPRSVFGCLFLNKDGAPAEMFRCNVPGDTSFQLDRNCPLRIRECVLGNLSWGPSGPELDWGAVELDACIVSCNTGSTIGHSVPAVKKGMKSRWNVRRCLFESRDTLFYGFYGSNFGFAATNWTGERNYYRLGSYYTGLTSSTYATGLQQWRAATGSKETGSVEGDPLIAEPQRWRLQPGSPASGSGPDVDKIARRAPGTAEISQTGNDAWLKQVAALPAKEQVDAVKTKLMQRNPGFDGKVTPTIDKTGVVIGLEFLTDHVTDIAPVRALAGLRTLKCNGSVGKGQLADLAPPKGMQLTSLVCGDSKVADLLPLKDMKLISLDFGGSAVSDLSPLKDMSATLATVWLFDTKVADLSPLKDMKLTRLDCNGTKVADLSPIKGMPLKSLTCDFQPARDAEILRSIKTLETINGKAAAAFWKEAGQKMP